MRELGAFERRSSKSIWVKATIFLLAFLALATWAYSSPPGSSPDDDYHMASIWCSHGDRPGICESTSDDSSKVVPILVSRWICFALDGKISGACTQSPELNDGNSGTVSRGNFSEHAYPGLYYWVDGFFASTHVSLSIFLIRLFNIIAGLGMIGATLVLATKSLRPALKTTFIFTSLPLSIFIFSSINPSSWVIIAVPCYFVAAVSFVRSSGIIKFANAALLMLLATVAAGTRADAAAYIVFVTALALIYAAKDAWRGKISLLIFIAPVAIAILYYLTAGQSSFTRTGINQKSAGSLTDFNLLIANITNIPELFFGAFGFWPIGWLDTPMPGLVKFASLFTVLGVAFWGLQRISKAKALTLGLLAFGIALFPLYILQVTGASVGQEVQPRYILPLLILFVLVSQLPSVTSVPRLNIAQSWLVIVLLSIGNSLALHTNLNRYVIGLDHRALNLNVGIEWWWQPSLLSPMATWIVGSIAFSTLIILILAPKKSIPSLESNSAQLR